MHASVRLADKATGDYLALVTQLQHSGLVHSDETGWRIGRLSAWLWVFCTDEITVYVIDYRRSSEVVLEVLGEDFAGRLMTDGPPALDALDAKGFHRVQCNSHIIRRCKDLSEVAVAGAVKFPRALKATLQDAIEIGKARHRLPSKLYRKAVAETRQTVRALVSGNFTDAENLKLAKHVFKHQARLLEFLDDPLIPPTNNLAEHEVRGAVVLRKIGGCHRAAPNAHAHAILASHAQTAQRRGETLDRNVARWMALHSTSGPPHPHARA